MPKAKASPVEIPKVDESTIETKYLDKIIKQFGNAVVRQEDKVEVISTGSLALDASMGVGGAPRGRFTVIYGPEGSGKTTIALTMAKNVTKAGGRVLYIDAEVMLSYDTIELMLGEPLDSSKFVLLHPETAEDAFMVAESLMEDGEIDLIVVDTVASLEPRAEKEKDLDKATMAEISRLLPKFFRKDSYLVKKSNVAFVFLNQVRDNVGSYSQGYNMPSGHALKHHASVIVALTKGGIMGVGDDIYGIKAKFVIKKNKLAAPFRSFTIPITFGKGIDSYLDTLEFCEMLGVIEKAGSYFKFDGETIAQGKLAASEVISKDEKLFNKIKERTYEVLSKYRRMNMSAFEDDFATDVD